MLCLVLSGARRAGCVRKPPAIPTKIKTKTEYFQQSQSMTPHGPIDMGSIKETEDGVEYSTNDKGQVRRWHVKLIRTPTSWRVPDGKDGEPHEIK